MLRAPYDGWNWLADELFLAMSSAFLRFGIPIVFVAALTEATIGLGVASTTDINAEDAVSGAPWSATGQADADAGPEPGTEGGYIKLTAAVGLQITIGTAALTAGRFSVIVNYDVSEG